MRYVSILEGTAKNLWSNGRGKTLVLVALGWSLSAGVRTIYPALLPHLRVAYGLDLTTAGLLLTVLWLAYAFGQLPGGLFADRIGEGRTMVVSMVAAAGALVLVTTATSAPILFVATMLFGFGTALYAVSRFTVLDDIYTDQLGTAVGLTSAMGDLGNSVFPPLAGIVAVAVAWQFGFGFAIPLYLVVAIGLWVVVPSRTSGQASSVDSISFESARYVLSELRRPSIIIATIIQCLGVCIYQAFTGFYPTYLIEVKGLSATAAASLFGLFFALGAIIKPISGNAYDHFSIRRSLIVVFSISGVAFVLLPLAEGFWPLVAVTALVSSMLGRGTIAMSYVTTAIPDDIQNTGFGLLRTGYFIIAALSPFLFGAVADRGFFDEAFLLLAVLTVVAIVLTTQIPDG